MTTAQHRNHKTISHLTSTVKLCFLLNIENLCNFSEVYGENMVNLITRRVSLKIVWRQCGDSVESVILLMEI